MTGEVTVTAEAPLLNTADASVGNTLEQRAIEVLPAEGRSVVELLSLPRDHDHRNTQLPALAVFLAGPEAGHITGQGFGVNGGSVMP
jgi:hypothetical protein